MQRKLLIFFYILFSLRSYAQQAIQFVENKGQWDERVLFKGEVTNGAFFIQENGYTVLQQDPVSAFKLQEAKHHTIDSFLIRSHAWRVEFLNAAGKVIPEKELPTYNNYFLGNDSGKWATACKIYQA
ncbi:MAG: hypothetical protein EBV71_05365, partial [Chitinophagia bacterium]|nr:hypothetical protein [Chitinophagia bacterium]